jgi:hypothetical protein
MTNAEILKAEFKAAVKSRFGTATPENIKKYFLLYDKNKDGAIQRDELYQLLYDINVDGCRSAVFKTCDRWTDGVMDQIDTDKDGKITWEEYRVAAGLPKEAPPPPPPPPSKDGKDGTGLTDIEKGISGSKKPEEPAKEEVAPAAKEEVAPAASVSSSSGGALGAIALAVAGLGALFFFGRK